MKQETPTVRRRNMYSQYYMLVAPLDDLRHLPIVRLILEFNFNPNAKFQFWSQFRPQSQCQSRCQCSNSYANIPIFMPIYIFPTMAQPAHMPADLLGFREPQYIYCHTYTHIHAHGPVPYVMQYLCQNNQRREGDRENSRMRQLKPYFMSGQFNCLKTI